MKYEQKSFTVPATGKPVIDCSQGHTMTDIRGKCLRCGERLTAESAALASLRASVTPQGGTPCG